MTTSALSGIDAGALSTGGPSGGAGGAWGLRVPGGAASATGAPHCSQKSPSRCSGPLQKRQSTVPPWTSGISLAFFKASSSNSTMFRPRLARRRSSGTSSRGATIGEVEVLKGMVEFGKDAGRGGDNS